MLKRLLFSADGADGGDNAPPPATPPATNAPAPPPAASIVLQGTKSEREIELEEENSRLKTDKEAEAAARKKVEMDAGQLQDEVHRLKTATKREPKPETRSLRRYRAAE